MLAVLGVIVWVGLSIAFFKEGADPLGQRKRGELPANERPAALIWDIICCSLGIIGFLALPVIAISN